MNETNKPGADLAQVVKGPAGVAVRREDFGGSELAITGETAGTAAAATAKAMVEARFVMAMRRPRSWLDVRAKIMAAIERPGFAGRADEKTKPGQAWYRKPVGDGVEGFSIRFAEEALRCMGNVDIRPTVVYEDTEKRIVDVMVLDLESNISFAQSVVVPKTVERASLRQGEQALRVRTNSFGKPVYIKEATDDEILVAQNSAISKIMRNEILRLLPGDIQADARERILEIRYGKAASDPLAVQKEVSDGFQKLNIMPSAIASYLGHDLATCTPAELANLRELYAAVRDGKANWHDVLREALAEREGAAAAPAVGDAKPAKPPTTIDAAADALKNKAAASAPVAPEPETKPADEPCSHPHVPPSRIAQLKAGHALICPDCDEELVNEAEPPREPGSDDGDEAPAAATSTDQQPTLPGAPPRRSGRTIR